jgi:hypothetical protein
MNLNTRRLIALLAVVMLSILFGLAAWALTASPTVTVIFVVLDALVGLFVLMAQQRGSFPIGATS